MTMCHAHVCLAGRERGQAAGWEGQQVTGVQLCNLDRIYCQRVSAHEAERWVEFKKRRREKNKQRRAEKKSGKRHMALFAPTSPMGGNVAFTAVFAQRRTAFRTEINIMGLNLQGSGLWDAHTYTHTHIKLLAKKNFDFTTETAWWRETAGGRNERRGSFVRKRWSSADPNDTSRSRPALPIINTSPPCFLKVVPFGRERIQETDTINSGKRNANKSVFGEAWGSLVLINVRRQETGEQKLICLVMNSVLAAQGPGFLQIKSNKLLQLKQSPEWKFLEGDVAKTLWSTNRKIPAIWHSEYRVAAGIVILHSAARYLRLLYPAES